LRRSLAPGRRENGFDPGRSYTELKVNRLFNWSGARAPQAQIVLIATAGVLATLIAAFYAVDVEQGVFPKPLVALLTLAGAVVLFSIEPERLFLGWLVAAPLLQGLPDTLWARTMDLAIYVVPAVVLSLHTIARRDRRSPIAWFDFLPAAYLVLVIGSMALTTQLLETDAASSLKAVFRAVALGPLVYYFVAFRAGRTLTATRVLYAFLISCALQGAMAFVELPTKWNLWHDDSWHTDGISRSVATLQNPAVLGAFVGAGVVVALAVLVWEGPRQLRRISIFVLAVGLPGIAFTFTRGPIVATAVVGLLVVLLRGRARLAAIGVVAAAVLALISVWPSLTHTSIYRERVAQSRNVEARIVLQDWSLRLAKEKPILGWGYQSFDRVKNSANFSAGLLPVALGLDSTSHDTYLTVLVEYGGVGLFLLLAPFVVIATRSLRRARQLSPDRWLLIGGSAAVAVVLLTGATIDFRFFSFVPALPWLLLGLLRRVIPPQGVRASTS
jgi:O-antigen ligase